MSDASGHDDVTDDPTAGDAEQPDLSWPAPDHTTQVLDPDGYQTTAHAAQDQTYQASYATDQQAQQVYATDQYGYVPPPPGVTAQTGAAPASGGVGKYVAIAAITGLLAGLGGGALGYQLASGNTPSISVQANDPDSPGALSDRAEGSVAAIAAEVLPSVVSLEVSGGGRAGSGSGFVITEDGFIVTNNHVIEAAADNGSIKAVLQDGTKVDAELVGRNADYDLAVVKIDRTGLSPVELGNSDSVRVGDETIAVGAPLGLTGTVTTGIVSALNRPVTAGGGDGTETSFINAIQTDAAINPGNSGGPLTNAEGQVIGVNSAIASLGTGLDGQAGNIGLGFAIPINTANRIATEIMETGTAATPIIGATIDFNFGGDGARVENADPDGPAAKAGLKDGDVIVAVDGQRVTDAVSLITEIRRNAPGDEITLTLDNGQEVKVVLGRR